MWQVDGELVRWDEHASVVASSAIVTKIGEIENISSFKFSPNLDSRKHGTVSFAITTGVASL